MFTFMVYAEHLLGKQVAELECQNAQGAPFHQPSVLQIINYDFHVRKQMTESFNEGTLLDEALAKSREDATLRERYFTTPLSLSCVEMANQRKWHQSQRGAPYVFSSGFGGKSKGKSWRGAQAGKGGSGASNKSHGATPEGLQICFRFNNEHEQCDGRCTRLHVCRLCFQRRPMYKHHLVHEGVFSGGDRLFEDKKS